MMIHERRLADLLAGVAVLAFVTEVLTLLQTLAGMGDTLENSDARMSANISMHVIIFGY